MHLILLLVPSLALAGEFATSIGDANPYNVSAITADSAGNTYVVGSRTLSNATALTGIIFDPAYTGNPSPSIALANFLLAPTDVFVSKLDSNGKLLFTDTFAGKGVDTGSAIALDPSGNIYIAGTTTSSDFPLSKALQTQSSSSNTGFIIKLSNDGTTILYSTYFGGVLGSTSIAALATDVKGNLYLTGRTTSADFPRTTGMPFGPEPIADTNSGAILASISAAGDKILFAGALVGGLIPGAGSTISTGGLGVAIDGSGNAYFAGNIGAGNLPTTPGVLLPSGSFTGFLVKVNSTGTGLGYLTYLPGLASAIAVDAAGNTYVAQYTGFGHNGPLQASLAKINPSAGEFIWTNNLGGEAGPVQSMSVDAGGDVWATGMTFSSSFLNANGWTTGPEFVVGLNSTGSELAYSALYPSGTVAQSVALDPSGLVHVAGSNGFVSAIAPTAPQQTEIFAFQNIFGGNVTGRVSPAEVIVIYGPGIGPATAVSATPVNGFYPTTLAGVQVTINGVDIPLLYVSANQINAVVPMKLAPNAVATARVVNGTTVSADYPVWIVPSAPQVLPTVLNQDGTVNTFSNPAKTNSIVTFYATGWQSNFSPLADGQVATVAQNDCVGACLVTVETAGFPWASYVTYGGAAPGIVAGVTQFNLDVGSEAGFADVSSINFLLVGVSTLSVSVAVRP